jgi:hypothetical protein
MAELERCPFCGGESVLVPLSSCNGYIACVGECGIKTAKYWDEPMTSHESERTKWHETATKAWNRRSKCG